MSSETTQRLVLTVETEDPADQHEAVASLARDIAGLDIDRVDTAPHSFTECSIAGRTVSW